MSLVRGVRVCMCCRDLKFVRGQRGYVTPNGGSPSQMLSGLAY